MHEIDPIRNFPELRPVPNDYQGAERLVRWRRSVRGNGAHHDWGSVYCPIAEGTIPLLDCGYCVQCVVVDADPMQHQSTVRCLAAESSWSGLSADHVPVGEIMSCRSICVTPDVSFEALACLFKERIVTAALVVDDQDKPVGVVSAADLVCEICPDGVACAPTQFPADLAELGLNIGVHLMDRLTLTVSDVMTASYLSITDATPVSRAASVMTDAGVTELAVLSAEGDALGLITTRDLTGWLARAGRAVIGTCEPHDLAQANPTWSATLYRDITPTASDGAAGRLSPDAAPNHFNSQLPAASQRSYLPIRAALQPVSTSSIVSILVVDDDGEMLSEMVRIGGRLLVNVHPAHSSFEAMAIARRERLDGALISLGLEQGSAAYLLVRLLRSIDRLADLPVALIGDGISVADRLAASDVGVAMCLEWPVDETLFSTVSRYFASLRRASPASVLCIGEFHSSAEEMAEFLRNGGMHATHLDDPMKVLESLKVDSADVVLIDADLPSRGGINACRLVRSSPAWQELPVVFVGKADTPFARTHCYKAGASDFVGGNVGLSEVLARLRQHTQRALLIKGWAQTDSLTGLLTRRAFADSFHTRLAHTLRHCRPLSVSVIDLDNLESINDCYGHPVGDQVLQSLGALLGHAFRVGDLCARFGGDEFVVAMDGEATSTAAQVLSRVLGRFRQLRFSTATGDPFGSSFTAGIACAPDDGTTHDALLRVADQRLHSAKRAGKNQILPQPPCVG